MLATVAGCGAPQIVLSDNGTESKTLSVPESETQTQNVDSEKTKPEERVIAEKRDEVGGEVACVYAMMDCVGYGTCDSFQNECDNAQK